MEYYGISNMLIINDISYAILPLSKNKPMIYLQSPLPPPWGNPEDLLVVREGFTSSEYDSYVELFNHLDPKKSGGISDESWIEW